MKTLKMLTLVMVVGLGLMANSHIQAPPVKERIPLADLLDPSELQLLKALHRSLKEGADQGLLPSAAAFRGRGRPGANHGKPSAHPVQEVIRNFLDLDHAQRVALLESVYGLVQQLLAVETAEEREHLLEQLNPVLEQIPPPPPRRI